MQSQAVHTHERGSDMTLLQSVHMRLLSTGPTNIEGFIPVAAVAIMVAMLCKGTECVEEPLPFLSVII